MKSGFFGKEHTTSNLNKLMPFSIFVPTLPPFSILVPTLLRGNIHLSGHSHAGAWEREYYRAWEREYYRVWERECPINFCSSYLSPIAKYRSPWFGKKKGLAVLFLVGLLLSGFYFAGSAVAGENAIGGGTDEQGQAAAMEQAELPMELPTAIWHPGVGDERDPFALVVGGMMKPDYDKAVAFSQLRGIVRIGTQVKGLFAIDEQAGNPTGRKLLVKTLGDSITVVVDALEYRFEITGFGSRSAEITCENGTVYEVYIR